MATRKKAKTKKKQKGTVARKTAKKKQLAKKAMTSRKSVRKSAPKKTAQSKKQVSKKVVAKAAQKGAAKRPPKTLQPPDALASSWQVEESPSGLESGDLQELSNRESADSESVDELLEDGDAFEAEAVSGVEAADDSDAEVRTHEVPEDDVPEEYLDQD